MLGADGVLRPGGGLGAGSGQSYYLGYRGVIYLCGLTCFCRLGDPKSDSAQVHLFILQAGLPNRTRPGSEGENGESERALYQRLDLPWRPAVLWVAERTRPPERLSRARHDAGLGK